LREQLSIPDKTTRAEPRDELHVIRARPQATKGRSGDERERGIDRPYFWFSPGRALYRSAHSECVRIL